MQIHANLTTAVKPSRGILPPVKQVAQKHNTAAVCVLPYSKHLKTQDNTLKLNVIETPVTL